MVLITSGMIDRRHPDDRISHLARSILKLPSFIHIYIFACVWLYILSWELVRSWSQTGTSAGAKRSGLNSPRIRLFPYQYRSIATTPIMSASIPQAPGQTPQAPLVGSGTDYSSLVQGSTDPTDTTLVIRQVIPGMLTFSLPFVCRSSTLPGAPFLPGWSSIWRCWS